MKRIIKITDVESGKELEIVKGIKYCKGCFYDDESKDCPMMPNDEYVCNSDTIFQEVTNKEENENK